LVELWSLLVKLGYHMVELRRLLAELKWLQAFHGGKAVVVNVHQNMQQGYGGINSSNDINAY
jgi:hypothetical protein